MLPVSLLEQLDPGGPRSYEEMILRAKERASRAQPIRALPVWRKPRMRIFNYDTEYLSKQIREANNFLDDKLGIRAVSIRNTVAKYYGVRLEGILSTRRTRIYVKPRHVGVYLIHELTSLSYPQIAKCVHRVDHTSMLYIVKKIKKQIKEDQKLANEIDEIRGLLGV